MCVPLHADGGSGTFPIADGEGSPEIVVLIDHLRLEREKLFVGL